ncbi:all-trans retinoic acid-induced differentiation factor isoform X2 [Ascaphus truei]|uniref:all-trans retinoic acid-induced differentiation factor isoform X2 n=1 Tax=Ascaphus truei TaxID=8439 RepID=UPI003F599183
MAALGLCVIFLLSLSAQAQQQEQVCTSCPGGPRNSSEVSRLCLSRAGAQLRGRCCVSGEEGSEAILGLDLWRCSLTRMDPAIHLTGAVVVIDVSQNPLQFLPPELFRGLTGLQYIAIPPTLSCPGDINSWGIVETNSSVRVCRQQRSACNGTGALAMLCPENAVCAADGPGYTQCVCAPGFYGYKCLREGTFPMWMFFGILGSVTVTLSVLLWCTQRRKVKSQ